MWTVLLIKFNVNNLDLSLFLAIRFFLSSVVGALYRPPWPFLNIAHYKIIYMYVGTLHQTVPMAIFCTCSVDLHMADIGILKIQRIGL